MANIERLNDHPLHLRTKLPQPAKWTQSLVVFNLMMMHRRSCVGCVPLPCIHQGHPSSRAPHPITFPTLHGRPGQNNDAVVTPYRLAKGVPRASASGTGDHATVCIRAKGLRERVDECGWRGWKSECDCPCRGERKEHGGVEMAHHGLGVVMKRALLRARPCRMEVMVSTRGVKKCCSFLYIEANVHGPLSFQLLVRLSNLSHDGFHTPSEQNRSLQQSF